MRIRTFSSRMINTNQLWQKISLAARILVPSAKKFIGDGIELSFLII